MKTILLAAPLLALGLSACQTTDQGQYGGGPYEQNGYPQPYPQPYPAFPQPYPQGGSSDPQPYPGGGAGVTLARSEWRVTSINGRAVPRTGYYLNFLPDRIEAKLGCNSLGAGYRVQGEYLTAGALIATRMACADMSFETAGSNVLSQPMRFDLRDPRRLVLTNRVGTIEAVRSN